MSWNFKINNHIVIWVGAGVSGSEAKLFDSINIAEEDLSNSCFSEFQMHCLEYVISL